LFKARKFATIKTILNSVVTDSQFRSPVSGIVDLLDEFEFHFVDKLCDMLFRVCSDNRLFPEAVRVFDYVEEKGFVIEERSCFVLLLALKRCGEIELCLRFFRRMVESNGIEIRVQSLTLVIDGLCKRGEVEKAKELMDEMVTKSIVKPTVFTYNTLLNAYVGRKDRSGVGEILRLMEKEPVVFSVATYSILIQWYSSSGDIGEVTMFKKNYDHLPKDTYFGTYKDSVRGNPNYFLTYGNGKSVARVQDHLRPNGAHRWHNYMKTPNEIKLEEAAVLHYTYAKFSDLTSRRDRCGCKPTKEDVKRCFMLEFDRSVIIQSLRESGVFSSIIASAPTLFKDKFLHSIDSSNSTRAVASIFHSSRKVGRIKESQATARRILDLESSVFQESAVPPESPPGVVEDSNLISHS
ncbi:hypothetical protein RYX36_015269, partial [Vicia faba]